MNPKKISAAFGVAVAAVAGQLFAAGVATAASPAGNDGATEPSPGTQVQLSGSFVDYPGLEQLRLTAGAQTGGTSTFSYDLTISTDTPGAGSS